MALREATSDVQIAALLDGTLDAGIIIPPPREVLHVSLAYRRLFDEPLIAAVPEIWLQEGRIRGEGGILHPRDLADLPLVLFPRPVAPTFHDLVTGYFATHGIEPRFGQQAIQMQTLISLVSVGMESRWSRNRHAAWPAKGSAISPWPTIRRASRPGLPGGATTPCRPCAASSNWYPKGPNTPSARPAAAGPPWPAR